MVPVAEAERRRDLGEIEPTRTLAVHFWAKLAPVAGEGYERDAPAGDTNPMLGESPDGSLAIGSSKRWMKVEMADDLFILVVDRKTVNNSCAHQSDGDLFYIVQNAGWQTGPPP